ncbi:DarB-like antirestriction [Sinorhizobium phage PBC5]|uniref:DarB-like antirestriction n=1 Tax=Sinorhizobium phage PBC5 TaxID=179237 RepID=UPI001BE7C61E|nr:DarB-like antirestriction [Sinorhizobium phage PBC5]
MTETVTLPENVQDVQVGAMFASPDGAVHIRMPDHLGQPVSQAVAFPNDTSKDRVAGMVRVRDAFAKLRRAQIDEKASDQQIENLRARLNTLYDGFTKKHGPINADANKRLFRDDPTWPQISALEQNYDKGISATVAQRTGEKVKPASAEKAAIFSKRTQQPYRRPTSASSAKDALATVLNDFGRVNLDAMSALYGKPADAIVEELGPLLYKTPAGNYETSDHYLSGNVKKKLAEAERAAESDPDFRRNVAALRDVQPADIEAVDIDVKPGAPWIPAKHIEDFIQRIAETSVRPKAFYSRGNAKWDVDVPSPSAPAATLWGTDRAGVGTILSAVLNSQSITISDRTSDGKTVVNQGATDAANEKAERVKAEWRKWLWDNDARRDELVRIYNDTFNTDVLRSYDGAHLSLPGKVGDDIIELRPHQKSFIWRTMQSGTALADHTVGAGKTFAAIASAMEKRRIGQARKPMFVVPNHLVGQWGADFVKLYPGAKVLATTEKDFEKENRKRLFARIATGDWDAVIVAHSSFGRIGMDAEYEARFIQSQMDDLEDSISSLRRATGEKSRNVAQLTKWRDNLKSKMERLLDAGKKDDGLTFDELGVDALYVDEMHEFKNLAYSTSMQRVAGLGNAAGSQKAADLFMKSRFILERTNGNNVVFLTGTPLSNTMAEMFTVMRYLDEPMLRDLGISHFDAWAKVFGEVVTDWELSPSGQYKLNSRFAKFVNVPELMQHYLSFADVITNDDIKAQLAAIGKTLPLPKVRGGKPTNITVERSPDQASYIGVGEADDDGNLMFPQGSIVWRAENLPKKQEKGADNMLKVMSDARKAALDMRLVDAGYGDYAGSKVHRAADEMARIHKKWEAQRGIQLVFIDLSTPKKAKAAEEARLRELMQKADDGDEKAQEALDNMSPDEFLALQSPFSVYDDLRQKLIDRGVAPAEIAFIHDANTQAQKEELFGKVRSGRVRFLFGSTPKMGAGTNVQNRLVALHHIDAPWRPSDLEQRDGRGIRQGNELYAEDPDGFEIEILRYATKNTLDARTWQTIEAKARFIQQVRKGNLKTREIEDIAGEAANAAEMKAAASGNPLILEEMETRRRLRQLESQAVEHDREQHRIKSRARSLTDEAEMLRKRQPDVEADAARAAAADKAAFAGVVKGETFDKPKDFGAAIIAAIRRELIEKEGGGEIGTYAGFNISIEHLHTREFDITLSGARDYHVHVEDAADMDPTGTAMRVTNTVRRLANVPAVDKERMADIEKQAPALENQLGPWSGATELEETASKHRRLVEALRPKPKGKEPTVEVTGDGATAPDPARQNKRPDPTVAGADGRLRSAGTPSLNRNIPLRDAAIERVLNDGRSSGHEYLLAIDDDGSVVEYGTAGDSKSTGMSNRLLSAMANPDRKLVFYHNHPSGGPLSPYDAGYLAFPGLHSIWAAGHTGRVTRASLTEAAGSVLDRASIDGMHSSQRLLVDAAKLIQEEMRSFLQDKVNDKDITPAQATELHSNTWLMVFDRAAIIDFTTNAPYDTASVPGLDNVIDTAANRLAGEFFNDRKAAIRRSDRRAQSLGHIAELAPTPVVRPENAAGGREQTGPAETSAPDYQREDRGGEGTSLKVRRVTESRILEDLRGKLTDLQPALLKTIPLNYFSELARSNMTAVGEYMRVKRLMDAFRGKKHADADAIAQDWLKYTRLGFAGKDKAKAQHLADLMHGATRAGVDPSLTDEESKASPFYKGLRERYMAMPPKGRELFGTVRDAYLKQAEELDDILLDNVRKAMEIAQRRAEDRYKQTLQKIKDAGLTGIDKRNAEEDAASAYRSATTKGKWAAKARMTRLRIAFEASRVQPPYFPLGRFGRYFATVRDIDGKVLSFSKFERAAERDRAVRDLRDDFPNGKIETGVMETGADLRRAMDPRIVAEIEELLVGSGVSNELMDQVWQRYLESMPDLSARKRFIHRKGTSGFTGDALRVFSSHMFHAAHQMARLKYGLELQELVNETFDQAKEADDPTRAVTLANELASRHDWVMNPTGGKVAQTMTSVAFVWFLAGSVSAAMVNMTQTIMLGLPILGARFGGLTKAGAAIARASADSVSGRGSVVDGNLTADEKKAMEAFYESGLIDRTQSHDLAGVGETGVEYTPLRAKVMGVISWMFHRAEVWNREVTALAAYRMARGAGQSVSEAIDTAHDLTWKTHFDYSNSSRPALMQNDFAKVALVFRQHNINMLYRVFRDAHQAFKGDTPNARREARYQIAGITGMMALMAGVTGTIGFNLLMGIASLIFGDDDDPMDFEQKFRANVVDILGPELGGIVLNGAPGHYLGVDLSSRIGMPDLWFRSPTRELQGKAEYQYWLSQTLGATAGLGEQWFTGLRVMTDEGDVARGLEIMAPKPVRDLLKAYRYNDEGVTSIGGDQVLPSDAVSVHDVVAQALGFTPARISETYERNSALKNAESRVRQTRQRLVNRWAMAALMKDKETAREAIEDIKRFNAVKVNAGVAITKETLQRSIKTRAKNAAKREDGVLIQNEALGKELRDLLAEPIYR